MEKYSSNLIGNYLASVALHNASGEAVVYGESRLTWKALDERSNRMAQALIDRGVKKDDKVLLMFHNRPEFLEVNYAIQKCGAIPVPMNYRFTPPEIEFQADHSDAVAFVLEDIWLPAVQPAMPKLKKVKHYICFGPECPSDMTGYDQVMADYPPDDPGVATSEDDVCVLCYTGGTTGFPKGVMLTYGAHLDMYEQLFVSMFTRLAQSRISPGMRARIRESSTVPGTGAILALMGSAPLRWLVRRPRTVDFMRRRAGKLLRNLEALQKGYKRNTRVMFPSFPFFHDASYQMTMAAPIVGNQTFLLPETVKFDPVKVLEMVEREKPTLMANVPTGWKRIVEYPELDRYDTSSLVVGASGAGLCPPELKKKILEKFKGTFFVDFFGQTEMTPITSFRIDSSADGITDRSVGKPMVSTRIVDENGNDVPKGETGEIIYKSSTIMKGYYKDEERTSEVIKDGWFYSGDLGYLDHNGEIRVVERKKECINTGGEKVFPLEVEQVIADHPFVKNVCIIGVPDETWGNSIRAVVQLKEGKELAPQDIFAACEGKLAGYKKPRSVTFVDEFPLSPVGKVLRSKIRELHGKK